jgi:hypothetical protein
MKISGRVAIYNQGNISTGLFLGPYGFITALRKVAEHLLEEADRPLRKRL